MTKVLSTPELLPPDNFDMDIPKLNKSWVKEFLSSAVDNRGSFKGYPVYHRKTTHGGDVAILSKDKKVALYVMEYIVEHLEMLGRVSCATQTKVWKSKALKVPHVANAMLLKLLQKVQVVICDKAQTELGKKFWEDAMFRALSTGLEVGFVNFEDRTISLCEGRIAFPSWLEKLQWAWKYDSMDHHTYRFFIRRT